MQRYKNDSKSPSQRKLASRDLPPKAIEKSKQTEIEVKPLYV